jgi:hypothetical protein
MLVGERERILVQVRENSPSEVPMQSVPSALPEQPIFWRQAA